ncbi:uncharacterized protein At5g23160 [Trifolium pratense]|uniref:uncharacterized protein At5g23160 n=1 Tax=Trifolium pratense TaxID=57577 RepID=UPI001E693243|nr:uncharacterized protein At5g23160 [Trifolium pratense]
MAKTKTSSKSKTSIFLCCFGSNDDSTSVKESNYISKEKRSSWFSWRRIRIKMKSTSKTVPLEASFSQVKAYSKSRSKLSSTLHKKSKTPPTNPPPLPQPCPPHPATPYYSPTQTRHGPISTNNNITEDQIIRTTPTRLKRQERRLSSAMQNHTTNKNARKHSYDPIIGMSVLVVTLVIMIFWGRFCAILCTSAWLYFIPRFRNSVVVVDVDDHDDIDAKMKSKNVVDLDSEEYKKKVIMEGLLGRNNRGNNNK